MHDPESSNEYIIVKLSLSENTRKHAHTHAHTHAQTHTNLHTHTQANTHTHTHTLTPFVSSMRQNMWVGERRVINERTKLK